MQLARVTWELQAQDGAVLYSGCDRTPAEVVLHAWQDLDEVCKEGWTFAFPTFTTARPRGSPGRKPAGVAQCTPEELDRWREDSHRFPPYQYCGRNRLINTRNALRTPDVEEREVMLGFSFHVYGKVATENQGVHRQAAILVGLTLGQFHVIAWFLGQLCSPLGLCPKYPQALMEAIKPGGQALLQARLWRLPLRSWRGGEPSDDMRLVEKLSNLVSTKGEDIMLTTPSSQLCSSTGCVRLYRLARGSGPLWLDRRQGAY